MNDKIKNTLFLVDGSGYIFRAYHALPPMTRRDGTPVNAVLGFTNMLVKLLRDMHAPSIAVIFDAKRHNFRNDIYPDYKANRGETPEDLIPQFPLIREATAAFDIPSVEMEGYEADDLIATYAKLAIEAGKDVIVVSSDKDLMQLVRDGVQLFDPMKNEFMGSEAVLKKFGVSPDKVIDVQALAGDASDNVPGVPGIGVKTAAQLIEEYGDLETLLARAGEIKQPKRRESLIEFADDARISKRLVTLTNDVDVPVAIEDLKARDQDMPKLAAFLEEQGFKSVLSRLGGPAPSHVRQDDNSLPLSQPENDFPPLEKNDYMLINQEDVLQQWLDDARQAGMLAFDTETTGLTPAKADLVGISLCVRPGCAAYIPLGHQARGGDLLSDSGPDDVPQLPLKTVINMVGAIMADPSVTKVAHNAKYDMQMLAKHGVKFESVEDTLLMSYVLDGSSHRHNMDDLSTQFLGHTPISYKSLTGTGKSQITFDAVAINDAVDYAAEDADITLRLYHIFKPRITAEHMARVYGDIERPLIPVIASMEAEGVKVDLRILNEMSNDFGKKLVGLEAKIHTLAGHPFNIASPKQMGQVLFEEMGFEGGKKTKGGDWSTSVDQLEALANAGHEIAVQIMEWRQLSKLKSTYTDALQAQIANDTGRVHTSYALAATSTGRLASSDPNLQNIPIRTEEGRKIRTAFVAKEGHVLLSADYSQVELRLVAHMAGIPALQQAFNDDLDIHALTASEVFGVPMADMTGDIRRKAKAINFGIIYGISGWGLAKQLGIEPNEANDYIKQYFKRFPELSDYMEETKTIARNQGYVETLYGRKCYTGGINDKNHAVKSFAERAAINAPIQGTAADIIKLAMIDVARMLDNRAKLLLQVHDELIFEVKEDAAEAIGIQVRDIMENIADLSVPLKVDYNTAQNWADAH